MLCLTQAPQINYKQEVFDFLNSLKGNVSEEALCTVWNHVLAIEHDAERAAENRCAMAHASRMHTEVLNADLKRKNEELMADMYRLVGMEQELDNSRSEFKELQRQTEMINAMLAMQTEEKIEIRNARDAAIAALDTVKAELNAATATSASKLAAATVALAIPEAADKIFMKLSGIDAHSVCKHWFCPPWVKEFPDFDAKMHKTRLIFHPDKCKPIIESSSMSKKDKDYWMEMCLVINKVLSASEDSQKKRARV
jgi:hypothetical protein